MTFVTLFLRDKGDEDNYGADDRYNDDDEDDYYNNIDDSDNYDVHDNNGFDNDGLDENDVG